MLFIAARKILAGTRGHTDSYVIQLARRLHCSIDDLLPSVHYAVKVSGKIGPL